MPKVHRLRVISGISETWDLISQGTIPEIKKKLYILRYFEVNVILHTVSLIARISKYDFRIRGIILGHKNMF